MVGDVLGWNFVCRNFVAVFIYVGILYVGS